MFNANKVPVGKDQIQHIEMARDIAGRFNHIFGEHFVLPEAVIGDNTATLSGLDGRKMSKSYNNTIPLFAPEKKFRKLINKIKTNSLEPGEPKDPDTCTLFSVYKAFASDQELVEMRQRYADGIAWGEMKKHLFEYINEQIAPARERYDALIQAPDHIEQELLAGAEKARAVSVPFLQELRKAVGIQPIKKA
jgi:tryptophanyl-tRNA synthetase